MRLLVVLLCSLASVAAAEDWRARLADADPAMRVKAAEALAAAGAADAVPELAECLVDEDPALRAAAARALGRAGSAARPALPELKRLLDDTDRTVRAEALAAIARIGDMAAVVESVKRDRTTLELLGTDHDDMLRALLDAESWHVRLWILQLKHVRRKPPAEWTEPLARLAADDPAHAVRVHALLALASAPGALPHLRRHLANADPRMRGIAVAGLPEQLDDTTARAVTRLLDDPVPQLRARAAYALRARTEAAASIVKLLDDGEENVRETAAIVLASQGTWRDATAPAVVAAGRRAGVVTPNPPSTAVRRNLRAGGGMWTQLDKMAQRVVLEAGEKAAPHLARALAAESDAYRRGQLVHALGHVGAADALAAVLDDKDDFIRRQAAFCLVALGRHGFAVLQEVIGCLEIDEIDEDRIVVGIDWLETATETLVGLGKPAIPLLEARLRKLEGGGSEQECIEAILERIRNE